MSLLKIWALGAVQRKQCEWKITTSSLVTWNLTTQSNIVEVTRGGTVKSIQRINIVPSFIPGNWLVICVSVWMLLAASGGKKKKPCPQLLKSEGNTITKPSSLNTGSGHAPRAQPLTPLAPPSDATSILILVQIIVVILCILPGHSHKGRRGTACCLVCSPFGNLSVFLLLHAHYKTCQWWETYDYQLW